MAYTGFDESAGSPKFTVSQNQASAIREGKIPWADIDDLVEELFPISGTITATSFPGRPSLLARSVHFEPFVGDREKIASPTSSNLALSSVNTYTSARVTIQYETGTVLGADPVILNHRWTAGGEAIVLPHSGLVWADGGSAGSDITPVKTIPTIEHQITWPRVASPPFATIRSRIGCVNSDSLLFDTGSIYPETLLFVGCDLMRDILVSGAAAWQVTYHFSERRVLPASDDSTYPNPGGWNHFFRAEEPKKDREVSGKCGFYRLKVKAGESTSAIDIFEKATFAPLFVEAA